MRYLLIVAVSVVFSGCATAKSATSQTPASCLQAIDTARSMFGQMNKSADVMQVYVDQIKAAAIAGIDQDTAAVNRITRRIVRANRKIDRIGARMQTLADDFNLSSGECEK